MAITLRETELEDLPRVAEALAEERGRDGGEALTIEADLRRRFTTAPLGVASLVALDHAGRAVAFLAAERFEAVVRGRSRRFARRFAGFVRASHRIAGVHGLPVRFDREFERTFEGPEGIDVLIGRLDEGDLWHLHASRSVVPLATTLRFERSDERAHGSSRQGRGAREASSRAPGAAAFEIIRADDARAAALDFTKPLPTDESGVVHDARWMRYRVAAGADRWAWVAARHGVVVGYCVRHDRADVGEIVALGYAKDDDETLRGLLAAAMTDAPKGRTAFEAASPSDALLAALQDHGFRPTASPESVVSARISGAAITPDRLGRGFVLSTEDAGPIETARQTADALVATPPPRGTESAADGRERASRPTAPPAPSVPSAPSAPATDGPEAPEATTARTNARREGARGDRGGVLRRLGAPARIAKHSFFPLLAIAILLLVPIIGPWIGLALAYGAWRIVGRIG